ncbi:MAG: copper homeostasis protein CutC [Bacteroidota bacterium]
MAITLEICIDSVASALAAERGGAHRLELCDNLIEGGTTPSVGMVESCLEASTLPLMVMIRPRGGNFVFDRWEKAAMLADIKALKHTGIAGLVIGALNEKSELDGDFCQEMIDLAGHLSLTFHRAIDVVPEPLTVLDQLVEWKIDRVLSSGQAVSAWEGRHTLRQWVDHVGSAMGIMAGAGLNRTIAKALVEETGVNQIHGSASQWVPAIGHPQDSGVYFGPPGRQEYAQKITQEEEVKAILQALKT